MLTSLAAVAAAAALQAPTTPPGHRLIVQDLATGERRVLAGTDTGFEDVEVDPAGRVVALTGAFPRELVAFPPAGPAEVLRRPGGAGGVLSPDGRRLARIANGGHSVVLEDDRGREVSKVKGAFDIEASVSTAWSPDGARLAAATPGTGSRLVVLDARTGRTLRRVRVGSLPLVQPDTAWSTDGRRVVVEQDNGRDGSARLLDVATGRLTRLRDARIGVWVSATTVARREGRRLVEVGVLSGRRRGTARLPAYAGDLVPGPDARRIGFLGGRGRRSDRLALVPLDGGRPSAFRLADGAARVAWSDDGRRVAYVAIRRR